MNYKIYQIFYNEKTKNTNDMGFLQLDNYSNERPDWSEYWPIRKFIIEQSLEEDAYYGFLSPKFFEKTRLTANDVYQFLDLGSEDIVSFSPYFDQAAFPINIFEQAVANHRNIYPCISEAFSFLSHNLDIESLVMPSNNIIFCNFFVAKKNVWLDWFGVCEKIFKVAEQNKTELSIKLNSNVNHSGAENPAKVFIIERIISYLLISKEWTIRNFNPVNLPYATSKISEFKRELIQLDALKNAYNQTKFDFYLNEYILLRSQLLERI